MGAKSQRFERLHARQKQKKESKILGWEIDEDLFCAEFRVTLQKCKENEHDKQITGQIKTWFKNPFNKEGFKRVIINSH
ncbi:hypothetical protein HpCOL288_12040 [Helicobacter pylori]